MYLRKFPLHSQRSTEPGAFSLNSARNSSEVSSTRNLTKSQTVAGGSSGSVGGAMGGGAGSLGGSKNLFKLQLGTQRIEEDKDEDEEDSSSYRTLPSAQTTTPNKTPQSSNKGSLPKEASAPTISPFGKKPPPLTNNVFLKNSNG
jgi:hypothetical protein